jgi:hypothetical protein
MYLGREYTQHTYTRTSKNGAEHNYTRQKTVLIFRCDCCHNVFNRDRGNMNPKRVNNTYYHVCANCDSKKFAQEKGVEARMIWDMPVSSLKTLGQL